MTTATAAPSSMATVSLDELTARADLQTRVDRKYLVPVGRLDAVLGDLEGGVRVLEIGDRRSFGYLSVYFDTPGLVSYLAAARRRPRRFKVRTRTYLDAGECWAEVKTRGPRGRTVKHRVLQAHGDGERLSGAGTDLVTAILGGVVAARDLRPTLVSRFDRTTLYLPSTGSRMTIDEGLVWTATDGRAVCLSGVAVVETKTGSTPSSADRALWRAGLRPVRVSKYCTGMAALEGDLPATPWRRTLDREVLPRLAPHPAGVGTPAGQV